MDDLLHAYGKRGASIDASCPFVKCFSADVTRWSPENRALGTIGRKILRFVIT
ncbi:hypothetical protein [Roseovarius gaetbuli]|uniref:hypothetical protein n=1 Tax=Roseovarius gaetbuli TaxID=1356575 RepID=UPI0014837CCC|nr:hypothetical protein [Roseovarius gaetbuli]